ncbi:YihA family ribosome biogenesis GTP-binding protein [candidate division KSB1 bacterium]|nr:YihA family ribosome biogenesis GTP-binding protein [candidate division KSB1 bacterium]
MKITSVNFVKSAAKLSQIPTDDRAQIAFAGRSNVGKSSLMNALFNRKKLVLVSATPGKTRLLNFFLVNDRHYFVDLPGYGYAKVPKKMQENWQRLVEGYFLNTEQLRCVVVLIDIRHDLQKSDLQLLQWLAAHEMDTVVVGTKADKLSGQKLTVQLARNREKLAEIGIATLVPFSAITGAGKIELLKVLEAYL